MSVHDFPLDMTRKMRTGVYGVILHERKILLIIQKEGVYQGQYDLPGGGMEFGETPEQALRREFLEELNATFAKMTLLDNFTNVHHIPEHQGKEAYLYHRIALIYQIEGLSMHSCSSNEELLAFEWLNLDEIDERTVSPLVRDVMSWLKIRLTL